MWTKRQKDRQIDLQSDKLAELETFDDHISYKQDRDEHGCRGRDVRDVDRRPCLSDLHPCRTQAHVEKEGKNEKE